MLHTSLNSCCIQQSNPQTTCLGWTQKLSHTTLLPHLSEPAALAI